MKDSTDPLKRKRRLIRFLSAAAAVGFCVLVGVGILAVLGSPPMIADAVASAASSACGQKEREIFVELIRYKDKSGTLPVVIGAGAIVALPRIPSTGGADPAYFGRDMERFPIAEFPGDGSEPLVACNKDARKHHPDVVHVLYGDGAVRTLLLADLKAQGVVLPDTTELIVGPDSAHEDLRKMRRD